MKRNTKREFVDFDAMTPAEINAELSHWMALADNAMRAGQLSNTGYCLKMIRIGEAVRNRKLRGVR